MLAYDDVPALLTRLTGDEKHDWSSLSTVDVLWVLHDRVLGPDDRFLLSKGHGPAAFYALLAAKGLIPVDALEGFGSCTSPPPGSGAGRSATGCRSPSARRSPVGACTASSATPSSTRARTGKRFNTPGASGSAR